MREALLHDWPSLMITVALASLPPKNGGIALPCLVMKSGGKGYAFASNAKREVVSELLFLVGYSTQLLIIML